MKKSLNLIETTKVEVDGKEMILYGITHKEIFNEADIWVELFGPDFTSMDPPLPRELKCWWNSTIDVTVKPGSYPDTMPQRGKPRFSRMSKSGLQTWLRSHSEDERDGYSRVDLIRVCNAIWDRQAATGEF